MGKHKRTLYLDDDLWKKLRHEAVDRGISVSKLISEKLKKK